MEDKVKNNALLKTGKHLLCYEVEINYPHFYEDEETNSSNVYLRFLDSYILFAKTDTDDLVFRIIFLNEHYEEDIINLAAFTFYVALHPTTEQDGDNFEHSKYYIDLIDWEAEDKKLNINTKLLNIVHKVYTLRDDKKTKLFTDLKLLQKAIYKDLHCEDTKAAYMLYYNVVESIIKAEYGDSSYCWKKLLGLQRKFNFHFMDFKEQFKVRNLIVHEDYVPDNCCNIMNCAFNLVSFYYFDCSYSDLFKN